ncbi:MULTISPECIES: hypothetical protein [unclassified Schlesneria]|uniref:hypothetical protein n=1 Tax=Schlesneria TaxID=656899 RepID=UPI00359F4462
MSTANTSSVAEKFTESEVIGLVAEALDVPASTLNSASKAVDVPEWDSMGILGILSVLDREGIKCDIGNTESLQSIAGILETCRSAGRLK